MVRVANPLGTVIISSEYFANLVAYHAASCYGVTGMATTNAVEGIRSLLFGNNFPEKGVRVREKNGKLNIEIHIKVIYGINISAIVESISNKVKYGVEQATDLYVDTVDIFVDELSAE